MKKKLAGLMSIVFVLSLVLQMSVVTVAADTVLWTLDVTKLSIANDGKMTAGTSMPTDKTATNGTYKTTDDGVTVATKANLATSTNIGLWYDRTGSENIVKMSGELDFTNTTGKVSLAVANNAGSGTATALVVFDGGKVLVNNGTDTKMTFEKKAYDVEVYYKPSATDPQVYVSLNDGNTKQEYLGTADTYKYSSSKRFLFYVYGTGTETINQLRVGNRTTIATASTMPTPAAKKEVRYTQTFDDLEAIPAAATSGAVTVKYDSDTSEIWNRMNSSTNYTTTNATTIVEEAAGDKAIRTVVGDTISAQFRIDEPVILTSPVTYRVSLKIEKWTNVDKKTTIGLADNAFVNITDSGMLWFNGEQITGLELNKYYTFSGYFDYATKYVTLDVHTEDGILIASKTDTLGTVANKGRFLVQLSEGTTAYIDDVRIADAQKLEAAGATSFGVSAISPIGAGVNDKATVTFTQAVDTTAFTSANIAMTKNGTAVESPTFSWSNGNKVLSIPLSGEGKYTITVKRVKNAGGTEEITDIPMDFTITKKNSGIIFKRTSDDKISASIVCSAGTIDAAKVMFILAGYNDGVLQDAKLDSKEITGNSNAFEAELEASPTMSAYLWDESNISPIVDAEDVTTADVE